MVKRAITFFFIALLSPLVANAETYLAGKHYVELADPVRVTNPDKIEVVEVFWYGCGHCYRFESMIEKWEHTLAQDVHFVRSPAMWNKTMEVHAKAFYTAAVLGVEDKLHKPIFEAMHVAKKKLASQKEIGALFTAHEVSLDDFNKAFNSFGVESSVRQADARARSYRITGTPEMVVNGKYRVSAKLAGGQNEMLKVVDYLINKIRANKT